MMIITFRNWKKKLRILIWGLVLALLIGSGYFLLQRVGLPSFGSAENDRDARGSLKVDAHPAEGDGDWWGEFVETLKAYYQE